MNNLKVGAKGNEVTQLQQYLQGLGLYNGPIDGIFGPKTDAAVRQFQGQKSIKIDGIVGPITRSKMQTQDNSNKILGNPNVQQALANDPKAKSIIDDLMASGDFRGDGMFSLISNYAGMPVSEDEFNSYMDEEYGKLDKYYKELESFDKANVEDDLGLMGREFDRYLQDSAQQFTGDKNAQDKTSADNGVLFSTGRVQKLNNLQDAYKANTESTRDKYATNMRGVLRGYQNDWGTNSIKDIASGAKLGGMNYDAFTPGAKTNQTSLSQIYSPSSENLTGRKQAERTQQASINALLRLANKTNKQGVYGYKTQY